MPRHFTPEEVDALIPRLEPILRHLQKLKSEIDDRSASLSAMRATAHSGAGAEKSDPFMEAEAELEFLYLEANSYARRLSEMGGQLKGLNPPLVDFPGRVNGEDVLLCWRLGEPRVAYYHDLHSGFRGRRPLPGRESG